MRINNLIISIQCCSYILNVNLAHHLKAIFYLVHQFKDIHTVHVINSFTITLFLLFNRITDSYII
jgi:hypothetical protein